MATWRDLACENRNAAEMLDRETMYRASVSRAYYAAYAAVTAKLIVLPDVAKTFPPDRGNPSHKQLRKLVDHLPRTGVPKAYMRQLKQMLARLCGGRIDADYVPGRTISGQDSEDRIRDCKGVLSQLGLED